jgi:hypothetical protein
MGITHQALAETALLDPHSDADIAYTVSQAKKYLTLRALSTYLSI